MKTVMRLAAFLGCLVLAGTALGDSKKGLNPAALQELEASGAFKYLGKFSPVSSQGIGDGWFKHTYSRAIVPGGSAGPGGPTGPVCIDGSEYAVFSRVNNPKKLLIVEQGGGACWQGFYFCSTNIEGQEPPAPREGVWDFDSKDNPFADYSIVYMPYCDGSVFSGDNDVVDDKFPESSVRFHRGLRNQSAGMDLAGIMFPKAKTITVAGSSAGGVGAAGMGPFLARRVFGNKVKLTVFNDAGPIALNLSDEAGIQARAWDWDFGKFYPASCIGCDAMGQSTAIVDWRLANDSTIREAFYDTDGDATDRFFLKVPTQELYRNLLLSEHGALNASYPDRYRRFIVSGDDSHTALQTPLFYSQEIDGVRLNEWTSYFIRNKKKRWADLVDEFTPLP